MQRPPIMPPPNLLLRSRRLRYRNFRRQPRIPIQLRPNLLAPRQINLRQIHRRQTSSPQSSSPTPSPANKTTLQQPSIPRLNGAWVPHPQPLEGAGLDSTPPINPGTALPPTELRNPVSARRPVTIFSQERSSPPPLFLARLAPPPWVSSPSQTPASNKAPYHLHSQPCTPESDPTTAAPPHTADANHSSARPKTATHTAPKSPETVRPPPTGPPPKASAHPAQDSAAQPPREGQGDVYLAGPIA